MKTKEQALEELQFIRNTMERSTQVTSVSGIGLIAMGLLAIAGFLHRKPWGTPKDWWIDTWFWRPLSWGAIIGFLSPWGLKANKQQCSILLPAQEDASPWPWLPPSSPAASSPNSSTTPNNGPSCPPPGCCSMVLV